MGSCCSGRGDSEETTPFRDSDPVKEVEDYVKTLTPGDINRTSVMIYQNRHSNDPKAQVRLGMNYQLGVPGVEKDEETAVYWYRKAAEQGDPTGQSRLAHMYRFGKGVEQDISQAFYWYNLAAAQGDPVALKFLQENSQ